jgi:hypothetical protein
MNKTSVALTGDSNAASVMTLQDNIKAMHETALSILGNLEKAKLDLLSQRSTTSTYAQKVNDVDFTSSNRDAEYAGESISSAEASISTSYDQVTTTAQWIAQYSTSVNSYTTLLNDSTSAEQASVDAVTAHNSSGITAVHDGIQILNQPYYDANGNVLGRSTITFIVDNQAWLAPADPNPSGPPKYPRWSCTAGESLGRQNSYAGSAEDQPQVTWQTCDVSGDTPFKFIWQFRTVGTTAWIDFAEPGSWANTGHKKIDKLQTVSITTPYHKLGDSAWTTMRQSKIVIQPHTIDEHGITHICDVRCMVVSQATEYSDETNLVPSAGYADMEDGSLYSKDETNSLVIATALNHAGYLSYRDKTRYLGDLKRYVPTRYHLLAFKGYHFIGPCVASRVYQHPLIGMFIWKKVENIAVRKTFSLWSKLFELMLATVGLITGGNPAFSRQYRYYQTLIKRSNARRS